MEIVWPAKVSASKASCTTMPMATPINSSCTAANIPAAEKIDSAAGTCTSGAIKNASASDMTILMRARDDAFAHHGRRQHEPADTQYRPPHSAHPLGHVGGIESHGLHARPSR